MRVQANPTTRKENCFGTRKQRSLCLRLAQIMELAKELKKNAKWNDISKEVSESTKESFVARHCKARFQYVKDTYVAWLDDQKRTGVERKEKPPFAEEMEKILDGAAIVRPQFLLTQSEVLLKPQVKKSSENEYPEKEQKENNMGTTSEGKEQLNCNCI